MPDQKETISVLMVCLGRSPMAEAVLNHQIAQNESLKGRYEITVDSAGTGAYHVGETADERTIAICRKHAVPISCRARAVSKDDYATFDYILAMDQANLQTLLARRPARSKAHLTLFGSFSPSIPRDKQGRPDTQAPAIEDPYYGGRDGFEKSYVACVEFSKGFLEWLQRQRQ